MPDSEREAVGDNPEPAPPGKGPPQSLAPVADDLVRLLGWVLAGGFALSALTLAACRVNGTANGLDGGCRELVPTLEQKHQQALDTLVTLLAGAGLGRMH